MIIKVKEPQPPEREMLRPGQVLFTYLHLAPDPAQTADLVKSGAVCIAYETVTGARRRPAAAHADERSGRTACRSRLARPTWNCPRVEWASCSAACPAFRRGQLVVMGGGVVGTNALQMAVGAGAGVTVIDRNVDRLRPLDLIYGNRISTCIPRPRHRRGRAEADLVIGAVLVPGAAAPSW